MIARLKQTIPSELDIEVIFIPEVFDRYLAGDRLRLSTLLKLDASQNIIAVVQLSMVNSAESYSKLSGKLVLSPVTAFKNKNSGILIKIIKIYLHNTSI